MAAVAVNKSTKVSDEVQITSEDQKMINSFANKNSKNNELKSNLANKKKELQNLDDARDELDVLSLEDDTVPVPIQIGEVFVELGMEEAQDYIETCRSELQKEIDSFGEQISQHENELKNLKVKLYAKFGNNINLEEDDDS